MTAKSKRTQILGLVGWLAVVSVASVVGALASISASEFYLQLVQPGWAPPPWVFGPMWSLLYTLMGIAAWLVWLEGGFSRQGKALGLFLLQLAVNALWSWLFFAWRLGAVAFAEVLVLWVLILFTLLLFWRVNRLAGVLLLPYLAWVGFAALLNFSLWQLNSGLL